MRRILTGDGQTTPHGVAGTGGHFRAETASAPGRYSVVRLIPPAYVKPCMKRQKSDMADAWGGPREAVTRPNMHFVPIKTPAQQAPRCQDSCHPLSI